MFLFLSCFLNIPGDRITREKEILWKPVRGMKSKNEPQRQLKASFLLFKGSKSFIFYNFLDKLWRKWSKMLKINSFQTKEVLFDRKCDKNTKKIRNRSSLYWYMLGLGHILKGKWRHFFLLDAPLYSFCTFNFWIFFIQITTTSTVEKNWTPRSISNGMF